MKFGTGYRSSTSVHEAEHLLADHIRSLPNGAVKQGDVLKNRCGDLLQLRGSTTANQTKSNIISKYMYRRDMPGKAKENGGTRDAGKGEK
jgi:aminoglycoside N3'-acetyltransferase